MTLLGNSRGSFFDVSGRQDGLSVRFAYINDTRILEVTQNGTTSQLTKSGSGTMKWPTGGLMGRALGMTDESGRGIKVECDTRQIAATPVAISPVVERRLPPTVPSPTPAPVVRATPPVVSPPVVAVAPAVKPVVQQPVKISFNHPVTLSAQNSIWIQDGEVQEKLTEFEKPYCGVSTRSSEPLELEGKVVEFHSLNRRIDRFTMHGKLDTKNVLIMCYNLPDSNLDEALKVLNASKKEVSVESDQVAINDQERGSEKVVPEEQAPVVKSSSAISQ